jgi:hypothetical protein
MYGPTKELAAKYESLHGLDHQDAAQRGITAREV